MEIINSDNKGGTKQRKRRRLLVGNNNNSMAATTRVSASTIAEDGSAMEEEKEELSGAATEGEGEDSDLELDFPEDRTGAHQKQPKKIEKEVVKDFFGWKRESKTPRKEPLDENTFEVLARNHSARAMYKSSNIPDTITEFTNRFHKFTNKIFEDFNQVDWKGMVITGGTIVACMMAEILDDCSTIFRNADIDIFLFGIGSPDELSIKTAQLFKIMKIKIPGDACYAETPGTYSAYFKSPYRPVQVIRTRYENLEDILSGFDVDCCSIAYQGPTADHPLGQLVSTKRAYNSLVFHRNIFKFDFRNDRYEIRLIKYAKRGFEIWVSSADWPEIDKTLLDGMHEDQCHGCLKLAKYSILCKNQPDLARVEQRTRFVPFDHFSPESFSTIFETWKGRMDLSSSGTSVGELAHFYVFQSKPTDIVSSEDAKWKKCSHERIQSPHPWEPVYQAKSLKEGLLSAKSRLTEARQWSEQHQYVSLQKYFHAALPAADLHTHLGGMGSFEFWFREIMNTRMRFRRYECSKSKKDSQFPIVHWYGPRLTQDNHPKLPAEDLNNLRSTWIEQFDLTDAQITGPNMDNFLLKDLSKDEYGSLHLTAWRIPISNKIWEYFVNHPDSAGVPFSASLVTYISSTSASTVFQEKLRSLYTHDVIITLEALKLSLVDPRKEYPSIEIHQLLGTKMEDFKEYIYFNELTQVFEYTENGISTLHLYECVNRDERYQDSLENAFRYSNTSNVGANATTPSPLSTGLFTPDFYPNKFRLRKLLFEQDLRTLSLLLRHTLLEYHAANVNYVEYSVGLTDLLCPWIWPALLLYRKSGPCDIGVEFNFLAGFPRGLTKIYCNLKSDPGDPNIASSDGKLETIQSYQSSNQWQKLKQFNGSTCINISQAELVSRNLLSFEQLTALCERFRKFYFRTDTQGGGLLRQYVVGFDLFGDEMEAPFIPFADETFLKFGIEAQAILKKDAKNDKSQRFGFRIHCGEISAPPSGEPIQPFCYKMRLATEAILSIAERGIPVRVGHGVAFAECFQNKDETEFGFITNLLNFCQNRKGKRSSIAFEVNPTSNLQLLQNASGVSQKSEDIPHAKHVMLILSDPNLNLPICIGTDDDGIFNPASGSVTTGGPTLSSVAYQFYVLGQLGILEEKLICHYKRCSQFYSFGKRRE